MTGEPLVCPGCATAHGRGERFCRACGMPLVYAAASGSEQPVTEQQEQARKIRPQYSEGELVKVAGSRNQSEAEMIQGLLLEEGIPSMLRRTRGFDVPDMLAAGPRDVMVPLSGHAAARDVLLQAELLDGEGDAAQHPAQVLAWLIGTLVVVALIAWVGVAAGG